MQPDNQSPDSNGIAEIPNYSTFLLQQNQYTKKSKIKIYIKKKTSTKIRESRKKDLENRGKVEKKREKRSDK